MFEIVIPGAGGESRPFSDVLLSGVGDRPVKAIRQMVLLALAGFPPANRIAAYELADDEQPRIYRLKVKPHCWRLYFWADSTKKRFVFLHAVCKKKSKSDEQDATKARDRLTRYQGGKATIEHMGLPNR